MSMMTYGVQSKCMVLKHKDLAELLLKNKNKIQEKNYFDFTNINSIDDIDFSDICDFAYYINYACYFGDITGYLILQDDESKIINYENEDIIIIELEKDDLFHSYKDYKEIYDELIKDFQDVGINIDIDYIKEHFGNLNASYYA